MWFGHCQVQVMMGPWQVADELPNQSESFRPVTDSLLLTKHGKLFWKSSASVAATSKDLQLVCCVYFNSSSWCEDAVVEDTYYIRPVLFCLYRDKRRQDQSIDTTKYIVADKDGETVIKAPGDVDGQQFIIRNCKVRNPFEYNRRQYKSFLFFCRVLQISAIHARPFLVCTEQNIESFLSELQHLRV